MSTGIEVLEIGARTPVGLVAESSAAAVRAGIVRTMACPLAAIDPDGEPKLVAADATLGFELTGVDRLLPLARSVIEEVLAKLGPRGKMVALEIMLVLPEARPGVSERALERLLAELPAGLELGARSPATKAAFTIAGRGQAGVAAAVQRVVHSSTRDRDVLSLVVGVDSHHHPDTLLWLEHARHFGPDARSPIIPGEAAACLVLAPTHLRKRLGLIARAIIEGVGLAHEPCAPDSEGGSFGVGLTRAIEGATAGLQLPTQAVDATYSDINGERYRSEEWGFVAMRIPAVFKALEYEAPANLWGDVGAASSALGSVLAVQSWARGYAPGPRALVLGGSSSGARGAILLRDPKGA